MKWSSGICPSCQCPMALSPMQLTKSCSFWGTPFSSSPLVHWFLLTAVKSCWFFGFLLPVIQTLLWKMVLSKYWRERNVLCTRASLLNAKEMVSKHGKNKKVCCSSSTSFLPGAAELHPAILTWNRVWESTNWLESRLGNWMKEHFSNKGYLAQDDFCVPSKITLNAVYFGFPLIVSVFEVFTRIIN